MESNEKKNLPPAVPIVCFILLALVIGIIMLVDHQSNVKHSEYAKLQQTQREREERIAENNSKIAEAESNISAINEVLKQIEEYERQSK